MERFGEFLISNERTLRWEHMQVRRVDGWKQFGSSSFEVVEEVKRRWGVQLDALKMLKVLKQKSNCP